MSLEVTGDDANRGNIANPERPAAGTKPKADGGAARGGRKALFLFGVSLALFGVAASTPEIQGCITLPIDGIFYLLGTTSHKAMLVVFQNSQYIIMVGVFVTAVSLIFFYPFQEGARLNFHFRKWNTWKRRRVVAQFFVLAAILVHIGLVAFKKTTLPSLCPLSAAELGQAGLFGPSATFYAAVFALVLVFGRGLCGWACVYTPVQEQASNLLTVIGKPPTKRKHRRKWIVYLFTALFWTGVLYGLLRSIDSLSYRWSNGMDVGTHWIFIAGLLTMFPITVMVTHYLGSRFFCKYLCPLGGTMSLYSKFSLLRMKLEKSKCDDCKLCSANCQMGVDITHYIQAGEQRIADGNCIVCGDCVDACPKDVIAFGFGR